MATDDCPSQSDLPRLPGEPCEGYVLRLSAWNASRSTGGYSFVPPVGLPASFPGSMSPRILSLSTADPKGWTGLPLPIAIPVIPAPPSPMDAMLRAVSPTAFPELDPVGIGPLPVGVPSSWEPPSAAVGPFFAGPAGSVDPGLRAPEGDSTPVRTRDAAFAATGYDRTWGVPPPMTGMYAGLVWSPDRFLFEPGASLPTEHWYRALVREGVYVQAYQDDETAPGVWKYRYVRAGLGVPNVAKPYFVHGALADLYREQEMRDRATIDKAATERIQSAWKSDTNWIARAMRGEAVVEEPSYVLPEKYKQMVIKKEPVLLPMPMWSSISKASVIKMYEDAGLPPPEFPGDAAVANSQAFQTFKDDRGHVNAKPEDNWRAAEEARKAALAAQKEAEQQADEDRSNEKFTDVPSVVGMTEDDATKTLRASHLSFDVTGDTTGKARVYSQRPSAGDHVAKGSTVGLRFLAEGDSRAPKPISSSPSSSTSTSTSATGGGSPNVPMPQSESRVAPSVVGMTLAQAIAVLKEKGLSYATPDGEHVDATTKIIAQSPHGGEPTKSVGKQMPIVTLYFKKSEPKRSAPNVVGRTMVEAEKILDAVGMTYTLDSVPTPFDRVRKQYPPAGSPVNATATSGGQPRPSVELYFN